MKTFASLRSALIYCVLLMLGTAHAQQPQGSPYDGMSAIDIRVAAAMEKQKRSPESQVSSLDTPTALPPAINFFQCDIVELKGRFMHEGWYPIPGSPLPGTATAQAELLGPWKTTEFRLVSASDAFLQAIELALDDEAADGMTFLGSFEVPDKPFKMAVSGVDTDDAAYDVICPKVFQPQTLEVRFDALFALVEPGLIPLTLNITNHGPAGTFLLSVEDDMGVGTTIDDAQVELDQDETAATTVHVDVPSISVGVLDITVKVTASSESNPGPTNYGTTLVRVQRFNLLFNSGFESTNEGSP